MTIPVTSRPWNVMEGRTLWHLETDASVESGAGVAVASFPKSHTGYANAHYVMEAVNAYDRLRAEHAEMRDLLGSAAVVLEYRSCEPGLSAAIRALLARLDGAR